MKTKHILLLGLGSLTATAAIATPIALVNSDFGGGGEPTRIVVGNVNNDSATLQIPFSEKISSTKATVTLVYENKEEQVEAEIVNENNVTKVILTNLKPNTNYQIKEIKIDDKIINFKDSQFATKDNTLEQDVVLQPKEEQKLPKTVDKTDENKEESKKSDNQQEDKYEHGQSTKVEEPVVTPGVGAQPAVLPQQVESKEADNSAEKQKEEEPKDQSDNSGPSSNIPAQNEVTQPEPEVKQETEKDQEKTQPKVENSSLETSVQDSRNQNEASGPDSASPQVNSPSEAQTQENQISNSAEQSESAPKDGEQVSQPSTTTSTPSDTSSVENTQKTEATPAQTPSQDNTQDSSNASQSTSNPEATTNQGTSSHTNNLQADTSTTIKVGYWRVDQYSTKNEELTNFIVKIIDELQLSLLVLTDISQGQQNDGKKIVSELNKKNTELPWKQITGSSDPTGKSKRKVSFIYNSQFVDLTSNSEIVKLSKTDQDDYTIPPALVKFKTKNNKSFSIVSSVLKSNSRKQGKGRGKPKGAPSPTNNPAEKLKEQLSTLIGNEKNVIFIGDSGISTKNPETESPLNKDYKFINLEENNSNENTSKSTSKNDSTIFTKNDSDFQTEHPSLLDISNHEEKTKVTKNKPKRNPIYVDLKFN